MELFLFATYLLFIVTEIILNRMFRSKVTDKQAADKKSLLLLWVTILLSISLASVLQGIIDLPIYKERFTLYLGLILLYAGMVIRLIAVYTLGKYFTVDVTIRNDHKLKKDGLFKYVRHPNYIALLISFLGIGITFNNWLSLFIVIIPITIAFIIRINIEENVLLQHFGEQYLEYMKTTKKLIPYIY